MPYNRPFINLLPLEEKPLPNIGETYLRARAMANQNALAQQENEMNALKIQYYKENKGATNALELMTTPQLFDETSTGGKPGMYFPTKKGKPGAFLRKPLPGDLKKDKGDKETESDKEYTRLIASYSEDNPDIPKKDIENMIARAKKNIGGLASEKSLDSEMEPLLAKYRTRDKSYLPSKRMDWPPKFGGKGTPRVMDTLPDASEHKGKIIKELDAQGQPTGRKLKSNGKSWVQAMNANDVSLGSGMAGQAKSLIQLRKDLNDAYLKGDDQRAAEIERQIQEIVNQNKSVG